MNKLTNEQLNELKNLKSIDELKEFLTKENITLTDEEMAIALQYFDSGKSELADDDLDMIAGGGDKDDYERMAKSDGRTISVGKSMISTDNIFVRHYCDCFIEQVWARSIKINSNPRLFQSDTVFYDCKCYACGKIMVEHIVSITYKP
jgi:hypothetical protein